VGRKQLPNATTQSCFFGKPLPAMGHGGIAKTLLSEWYAPRNVTIS
jgi:hypothetical protein